MDLTLNTSKWRYKTVISRKKLSRSTEIRVRKTILQPVVTQPISTDEDRYIRNRIRKVNESRGHENYDQT